MILTLSSEGVRNAVFTDERGLPVYKSDTPFSLGVRTTTIHRTTSSSLSSSNTVDTADSDKPDVEMPVARATGGSGVRVPVEEEAGRIAWHCFGPSVFTIGGRKLKSDEFLPGSGFFGSKRTFIGPDGRRYRWDMNFRDVVLTDDESQAEIARYHRASLGIIGKRQNARLEIALEAAERMLDLVVLTFVYVEKLRKDRERRRRMAGASGGGP